MDNPERHLEEFIQDYYYGEATADVIQKDAEELINFMLDRGWQFGPVPVTA